VNTNNDVVFYKEEGPTIPPSTPNIRHKLKAFKVRIDGLLDVNRLINFASHKYTILMISMTYLIGMFIGPLITKPEWGYLQSVWDRWQSLNVGILALLSSVLVFKATKYHSEQVRERQYKAARALLPDALKQLDSYCKEATSTLIGLWNDCIQANQIEDNFETSHLSIPQNVMAVFKECISYADEEFGAHLARVLANLQVFDTRLAEMCNKVRSKDNGALTLYNVKVNIVLLSKIHVFLNKSYKEARGMGKFETFKLTLEEYKHSFTLLNLEVELGLFRFEELLAVAGKAVESKSGVFTEI